MTDKTFDVAVVGATGALGEELLRLLVERDFPLGKIHAVGAQGAAGEFLDFGEDSLEVQDLAAFDFAKVQIAFFAADAETARAYAPAAAAAGCAVIDSSAQFRDDKTIPLLVPEINADALADFGEGGIVASPGSASIAMLMALKPIHEAAGLERINVVTYQPVSDGGKPAIEELARESGQALNGMAIDVEIYPKQIAFNVLPQIGAIQEQGYTAQELALASDTRRLLGDEIQVNATAAQVPVFYGHCAALHIETRRKLTSAQARDILLKAPGIKVLDEPTAGGYPTAVTEAVGGDAVYVGRIREDRSHPRGLNLWIVTDNVRKGGALNSIQIAELLVERYLLA